MAARNKTRLKKGNIFLMLLLIVVGLVLWNWKTIKNDLIEVGLVEQQNEQKIIPKPKTNTNDGYDESKRPKLIDDTKTKPTTPKKVVTNDSKTNKEDTNKQIDDLKTWNIFSENGNAFYLNEPNLIQVSAAELEPKAITALVAGRHTTIIVKDKNKGQYLVTPTKEGEVEVTLMAKVNGKIDIIGEKMFEAKKRSQTKEIITNNTDAYLWQITTPKPDTLLVGIPNVVKIAIAEVNPKLINAEITGQGNVIEKINANGYFKAIVYNPGNVIVTVNVEKQGVTDRVGIKKMMAVGNAVPIPKNITTTTTTTTTNNNNENDTSVNLKGSTNRKVNAQSIKRWQTIMTELKPYENISFKITRYPNNDNPETVVNKGTDFNVQTKVLFRKAQKNDLYRLTDIVIENTKGQKQKMPSITYEVE